MNTDMRIVMVGCQHFLSGIGNYSYELGRHIRQIFPETLLYKPWKAGHPDASFHQHPWIRKIHYKSIGKLHPYILPLFIRQAIMGSRGQVYHAHWFQSGLALTYLLNKPAVVTMHDVSLLHIPEADPRYTAYYRWALDRFRERGIPLIVVSEHARQDTLTYANYPPEKVHVVHNGINFERFFPMPKKSKERFTIVYAGGLGKRKNLNLLLMAYAALERKFDHIELKIAGAYPERTEYPEIAQRLKLKRCHFTGFLPDEAMNEFYNNGDLLIYPSQYEGFGFAPLEAMAAGLPVLTATGGALSETAAGGADTFEYTVDSLVQQATRLIESPENRQQLVEKGSRWVQRFTWQHTAQQTLGVYAQALSHSNQL